MNRFKIFTVFIFFISLFVCAFGQEAKLKLHFIDVGEGDAIFIESANGETCLIDTGNLITGFKVVKYLEKQGIRDLDCLIFTHPDLDHIGGAFFVLQMLKVKNIYDNGQDLTELAKYSDIYHWYEELVRKDKNYRTLKAKDTISLGEVILKVLWPSQPLLFSDYNANSLVIMIEYGKFRCLLTGDLTILGEGEILEVKEGLRAGVLKIGHHGASDANSKRFLTAVSPKIAIISVNRANIRGYPAEEVLERLKKAKVKLYRTDEDGDIVLNICQSKPKGFKVQVNKTQ
jgi:beta-lactamase superfamily II metal-dependent hydrolase